MEAGSPSPLGSTLPDAVLLTVASYLDAPGLTSFEILSGRFRGLTDGFDEECWRAAYHRRWAGLPRYRWERLRASQPDLAGETWKRRYAWVEADRARTRLTIGELESGSWRFNFTPLAGGRGAQTLVRCRFAGLWMYLPGYPALPCRLVDHDGGHHTLRIADFPPHEIERLPDGEWVVMNENVTIVSCQEGEEPSYHERGFQG